MAIRSARLAMLAAVPAAPAGRGPETAPPTAATVRLAVVAGADHGGKP